MAEVEIILGSKSDLQILKDSDMLSVFGGCGVTYRVSIISAHRHPDKIKEYTLKFILDDTRVFIAAAGMAAHLPGSISSWISPEFTIYVDVVVIGVALHSDGYSNAKDALYSMVRMPLGIPVLTAGIGKAGLYNAAISACQIVVMCRRSDRRMFLEHFLRDIRTAKQPIIGVKGSDLL